MKKLVRDRIPEIIELNGEVPHTRILSDREYQDELKKKLAEEALEASNAISKEELKEELADVHEVICSLCGAFGIKEDEIIECAAKKRAERGGFDKKIFLESVS